MADPYIPCDYCTEPISIDARTCPYCGGSITTASQLGGFMLAALLIIPLSSVFVYFLLVMVFPPVAADISLPWAVGFPLVLFEVVFLVLYYKRKRLVQNAKRAGNDF